MPWIATYKLKLIQHLLLLGVLCLSCSNVEFQKIPLGEVTRDTYKDQITIAGVLESSNSYYINCPSLRTDATVLYIIPEGTYVEPGDTVCILESREIENTYEEALKNLANSKSEYNKSKADLDLQYLLLLAEVQTIEASTAIAQLDSAQLEFTSPVRKKIIELELEKARIEKEKILNQLEFLKKIHFSELQKMQLKIKQQENRVDRAKDKLDMLTLTSDISGVVIHAYISWAGQKLKEGDVVWDMVPLIQIPDLDQMEVKLSASESSYKRIEKNQKVDIYIDAIPGLKLTGEIKHKEPVGKPLNKNSNVKFFEVIASIDSLMGDLKPGISATCDIKINEVKDTILIPYVSVFQDDSLRVVYIAKGDKFEKRNVELVMNNNNIGIVKNGVSVGEYVSLIRPPQSMIKNIN